jgi:hypothetical protein
VPPLLPLPSAKLQALALPRSELLLPLPSALELYRQLKKLGSVLVWVRQREQVCRHRLQRRHLLQAAAGVQVVSVVRLLRLRSGLP